MWFHFSIFPVEYSFLSFSYRRPVIFLLYLGHRRKLVTDRARAGEGLEVIGLSLQNYIRVQAPFTMSVALSIFFWGSLKWEGLFSLNFISRPRIFLLWTLAAQSESLCLNAFCVAHFLFPEMGCPPAFHSSQAAFFSLTSNASVLSLYHTCRLSSSCLVCEGEDTSARCCTRTLSTQK